MRLARPLILILTESKPASPAAETVASGIGILRTAHIVL